MSSDYIEAGVVTQAESDSIINDIRRQLRSAKWKKVVAFANGKKLSGYRTIDNQPVEEEARPLMSRYYDFIQGYKGANAPAVDPEIRYKDDPLMLTRSRWFAHRISADVVMQVLDSLHQTLGDSIPPLQDLIAGGLNDALRRMQFLSEIIDSTSLPIEQRREKAREAYHYFYNVMLACQGRNDIRNTPTLESHVIESKLLPYLTREERMNLLTKVMLTLQVNTYAHSSHLRTLVMTLLQGVIDRRPELLVGMPGCSTVAEVQAKSDSLVDFIGQAALFHDLGKNSMGAVVTNDFRRLYDLEFGILKTHPERGVRYLGIDSLFQCYHDITLGHHRWYDGTKGYPMTFDNTQSPIRVMIDIVTLCDGLEAATDAVGRNYNPLKIFQTLMEEFDAGAGTRYNPDIVQVIHDDPALWHVLEQMVTPQGCYTNYYDVYSQFFTK